MAGQQWRLVADGVRDPGVPAHAAGKRQGLAEEAPRGGVQRRMGAPCRSGVTIGTGGTARTFVYEFNSDAALAGTPGPTTTVRAVEFTAGQSPLQRLGNLLRTMAEDGINAGFDNNGNIIVSNATTVANGGNGTTAVTGAAVTAIGGAQGAIARVNGAITTAGTALATLGASLQQVEGLRDFSVQLRDSLREGLGALVDADLAEESARLSSLQTRQQLATQSLSIANQQSQSLLSLFR
jgi:flagellin